MLIWAIYVVNEIVSCDLTSVFFHQASPLIWFWTYLILLSDFKLFRYLTRFRTYCIWFWTFLIPNLSDSMPINSQFILLWSYLMLNLSDSKLIWFLTYLIPKLSDSEPIGFQTYLSDSEPIWFQTYRIPNLPIWFRTYLTANLYDCEHIWSRIYLIPNPSDPEPIRYRSWGLFGANFSVSPTMSLSLFNPATTTNTS
jgi:hypothetical protein